MPGNDAFEIPTSPIAPGRDRGPRLVVLLLVTALAGAFLIARWSSITGPDRALPTVGPSADVAEVVPSATPLPLIQWFTGPEAPLDDVFLEAGQVRRLRLASATMTDDRLAQPGRDLLLPDSRGGTRCLCWRSSSADAGAAAVLDFVRLDRNEQEVARTTIAKVDGLDFASPAPGDGTTVVALEPSPDRRLVYLARASQSGADWRMSLDVIDLAAETIVDTSDVADVAREDPGSSSGRDGDPGPVTRLDRPTLRVAPDGRHLLIATAVVRAQLIGPDRITPRAWIVELRGSRLGRAVEADGIMAPPFGPACDWIDFATNDLIVGGCPGRTGTSGSAYLIRRHDLTGGNVGDIDVGSWPVESGPPLIDTSRGVVYGWGADHTLRAVDLLDGGLAITDAADTGAEAPTIVEPMGSGPPRRDGTEWADGLPATEAGRARTLVGSPDGRLLYVTAPAADGSGDSGVWVFDADGLRLLEHWPALAAYESIALLEDGRWLAAIGRPGVTPTGGPAAWGTSLTIHDTLSGRPVLRIGDLQADGEVTFAWTEPPADVD